MSNRPRDEEDQEVTLPTVFTSKNQAVSHTFDQQRQLATMSCPQFRLEKENLQDSTLHTPASQNQSDASSYSSTWGKQTRQQGKQKITSKFLNALVTEATLCRLSTAARQLIMNLLDEIEEEHTLALESIQNTSSTAKSSPIHPHPNAYTISKQSQTTEIKTKTRETQTTIETSSQPPLQNCSPQTDDHDQQLIMPDNDNQPKLSDLMSKLNQISNKIDNLQPQPTYAKIASRLNTPSSITSHTEAPKSTIIIKPTNLKEIPKLATRLQSLQPPPGITLTKMRIQQRSIELRTTTAPEKDSLKTFLHEQLPENTPIIDKSPALTKIIFFDVPDYFDEDDIAKSVKTKIGAGPEFNIDLQLIKKVAARREGHENWTVQLPRRFATTLLHYNCVLGGMKKIFYRRHIFIKRCTKCQALNDHSASACTAQDPWCSQCGGKHNYTDCTAKQLNCTNCADHNKDILRKSTGPNQPTNLTDTHHSAASSSCPSYRYYFNLQKSRSNY